MIIYFILDTNIIFPKEKYSIKKLDDIKISDLRNENLFKKTFNALRDWSEKTNGYFYIHVTQTIYEEVSKQLKEMKDNWIKKNKQIQDPINKIILEKIENTIESWKNITNHNNPHQYPFCLPLSYELDEENKKLKSEVFNNEMNDFIINREINDFCNNVLYINKQNQEKKVWLLTSNLNDFKNFHKKYNFNDYIDSYFYEKINSNKDIHQHENLKNTIKQHILHFHRIEEDELTSLNIFPTNNYDKDIRYSKIEVDKPKKGDTPQENICIGLINNMKFTYSFFSIQEQMDIERYAYIDLIFFNNEWKILASRGHNKT